MGCIKSFKDKSQTTFTGAERRIERDPYTGVGCFHQCECVPVLRCAACHEVLGHTHSQPANTKTDTQRINKETGGEEEN